MDYRKITDDNLFLIAIVGVIDSSDAIHSDGYVMGEDEEITHGHSWPDIHSKRWRWTANDGVKMGFIPKPEDQLSEEQFDDVIKHLKKYYKLDIDPDHGMHKSCFYAKS